MECLPPNNDNDKKSNDEQMRNVGYVVISIFTALMIFSNICCVY